MIWYDMIMTWYGTIWYDIIWYDMIWYDYDMIWLWYGMGWYGIEFDKDWSRLRRISKKQKEAIRRRNKK